MAFETLSQKRKSIILTVVFTVAAVAIVALVAFEIFVIAKGDFKKNSGGRETVSNEGTPVPEPTVSSEPTAEPTPEPTEEPWIYISEDGNTILSRFNPPKGYTRVSVEPGSFAEYLRNYLLKPYGSKALLYGGTENPEAASIGVFDQVDPLIANQQCADTAIMLYAEYLYDRGEFDKISFNFLNGFKCDYIKWVRGYRIKDINGNKVEWYNSVGKNGVVENDYTYETFYKYLKQVYVYANTDSLAMQLPSVDPKDLQIGDVLIASRSDLRIKAREISEALAETINYGHAIVIADIAVNEKGEKAYLFVEGTTPATDPTVCENPNKKMCCWFVFSDNGTFQLGKSGLKWNTNWGHTFRIDEGAE